MFTSYFVMVIIQVSTRENSGIEVGAPSVEVVSSAVIVGAAHDVKAMSISDQQNQIISPAETGNSTMKLIY